MLRVALARSCADEPGAECGEGFHGACVMSRVVERRFRILWARPARLDPLLRPSCRPRRPPWRRRDRQLGLWDSCCRRTRSFPSVKKAMTRGTPPAGGTADGSLEHDQPGFSLQGTRPTPLRGHGGPEGRRLPWSGRPCPPCGGSREFRGNGDHFPPPDSGFVPATVRERPAVSPIGGKRPGIRPRRSAIVPFCASESGEGCPGAFTVLIRRHSSFVVMLRGSSRPREAP